MKRGCIILCIAVLSAVTMCFHMVVLLIERADPGYGLDWLWTNPGFEVGSCSPCNNSDFKRNFSQNGSAKIKQPFMNTSLIVNGKHLMSVRFFKTRSVSRFKETVCKTDPRFLGKDIIRKYQYTTHAYMCIIYLSCVNVCCLRYIIKIANRLSSVN